MKLYTLDYSTFPTKKEKISELPYVEYKNCFKFEKIAFKYRRNTMACCGFGTLSKVSIFDDTPVKTVFKFVKVLVKGMKRNNHGHMMADLINPKKVMFHEILGFEQIKAFKNVYDYWHNTNYIMFAHIDKIRTTEERIKNLEGFEPSWTIGDVYRVWKKQSGNSSVKK